jgi:hypothetical protein
MWVCASTRFSVSLGFVRFSSVFLASALLVPASVKAASGTSRFVRVSLDDEAVVVAPLPAHTARIIRSSLDEPGHAEFPLHDERLRLIRASLDEESAQYVHLDAPLARPRVVRTTLD